MTKTELLRRCARDEEERLLLARVLDKLEQAGAQGGSHTRFLSPSQRLGVETLLNHLDRPPHRFFGGYEGAERTVCLFPAPWLEEDDLLDDAAALPLAALETPLPREGVLTHRDILGSLMALGLTREMLGDVLLGEISCQVVVLRQALPTLLSQWERAGNLPVRPREIPLEALTPPPPKEALLRDTVATLRLDAVAACAFHLPRSEAARLVAAGRVALNHRPCLKGDAPVAQGDLLSCRGLGKCRVDQVLGQSRKGRVQLVLARYL